MNTFKGLIWKVLPIFMILFPIILGNLIMNTFEEFLLIVWFIFMILFPTILLRLRDRYDAD